MMNSPYRFYLRRNDVTHVKYEKGGFFRGIIKDAGVSTSQKFPSVEAKTKMNRHRQLYVEDYMHQLPDDTFDQ